MKRLLTILVLGTGVYTSAYTPTNWVPEHAASDFEKSDAIVVARVVGLNRSASTNGTGDVVEFHATLVVGRTIRGSLKEFEQLSFLIGEESVGKPAREDEPSHGMFLHVSQQSYSLNINGVYLVCLSRTDKGWEPRSGPRSVFSIHRVSHPNEADRFIVDLRSNWGETRETNLRATKERGDISIDAFLRERLPKTD